MGRPIPRSPLDADNGVAAVGMIIGIGLVSLACALLALGLDGDARSQVLFGLIVVNALVLVGLGVRAARSDDPGVDDGVAHPAPGPQSLDVDPELKDNLLSVISHEFRTPLTAIIGFAQTLRSAADHGPVAPEIATMAAERIERNGHRLSRMTGNMLATTMEVKPQLGEGHLVRETIQRLARELAAATDSDITVVVDMPAEFTVQMSRDHLRLLLSNLIDNGLKFAEPGTTLSIRGRKAGDEIAIVFTNRGPEIPPGMRERIFSPYMQIDLSDTRPYDGVGLGLHVVSKICRAHGGQLEVRSEQGLVVLGVTLPAGPGDHPHDEPPLEVPHEDTAPTAPQTD